jgi:acyl carrier protein
LDQSAWRKGQQFTPILVECPTITPSEPTPPGSFTGFHLITGGFGALGLELLQVLFLRGERRFLLLGRTQPSEQANKVITDLRNAGADILLQACDVTCLGSLDTIIRESAQILGPLTAITHAAGVLQAGLLEKVSAVDFAASIAAKKTGALNLHIISAQWPVERFVLVSSVSTLFGFPQHASYAVANSYLDGIAGYRMTLGLPALSLCYGPFLGKGLLERLNPAMDFALLQKMSMSEGLGVLNSSSDAQGVVAIMRYKGSLILGNAGFTPSDAPSQHHGKEGYSQLCEVIRRLVATLLQLSDQQIPLDVPLSELGVSSLLGVEIRNRLQSEFRVRMPATVLWNYPTVASLATHIESLLWPTTASVAEPMQTKSVVGEVDDSEEALMAQLLDELATIKSTYI